MTNLRLLAATVALSIPLPAAANTYCTGTVDRSYLVVDGSLYAEVSWAGPNWTKICNLKQDWKGVTPDICAGWLARLDAAVTLQRGVQFQYGGTFACSAVALGEQAPAPAYIMIF